MNYYVLNEIWQIQHCKIQTLSSPALQIPRYHIKYYRFWPIIFNDTSSRRSAAVLPHHFNVLPSINPPKPKNKKINPLNSTIQIPQFLSPDRRTRQNSLDQKIEDSRVANRSRSYIHETSADQQQPGERAISPLHTDK